jgi:epoxide hydrolase
MIEPFTARIPQAELDDLHHRLAMTRWAPEQPPGTDDGAYGVPLSRLRRLVSQWEKFDWRRWEDRLNAYPQFRTSIDGQPVHFLHVRSAEPGALPVVLSHGWPGSVFEYIELIDRLTDPAAFGGDPADAFHVVLPSLPGYGFSGPAVQPGWGTRRIAAAWAELMAELGYQRYGAIGNDAGSMIAPELGRLASERVVGVHVTQLFSFPSADPAELVGLAHALVDSPAGLLGWNAQLFDEALDDEFVLANVSLYWLTGTAGTSIRHYYENTHATAAPAAGPTTVPIGLAAAADGDFRSIRRFADRDHANITSWNQLPGVTGHYSAYTNPDQLTADIRRFFRPLRPAATTATTATTTTTATTKES